MAKGSLIVNVYLDTVANPIIGADVEILGSNIKVKTDASGSTKKIELDAPDKSLSENPQTKEKPYSTYDIKVSKIGLVPTVINNVEIFPDVLAYQNVFLTSIDESSQTENEINLDGSALWENEPPLITEDETEEETENFGIATFALPRVLVPEYIIVHDGIPSNTNAPNYQVPFVDYIKNVASSEIYSTWPKETIKANVHAIVSFTLNRIFTEWYLSKGYNFTITSTTSYDQKYTHNRTIFEPISKVVDEYFNEYITLNNNVEPYLAHYSDGVNTVKKGWLSQWGSKDLGDKGYKALDILKYYYGNSVKTKKSDLIEGLPTSFPGYNLSLGSCGEDVQYLQNQLNKIRGNYSAIPLITKPNGKFDEQTKKAVEAFQKAFNLSVTGIVDFTTWYKISYIYVAVSKMTESVY